MHLTGQDKWYLQGKWPIFSSEEKGVDVHMKSLLAKGLVIEKEASSYTLLMPGKMWILTHEGRLQRIKLHAETNS